MAYFNNTPLATEQIASTQPKILANFAQLQTSLNLNHTFNGNAIGSEASGSHQRLDMPNQALDITSLPTGIAATVYAIGGNIFSWNGAKRPISGISNTVTDLEITTTPQTIITLPNNAGVPNACIGMLLIQSSTGALDTCFFTSIAGVTRISNPQSGNTSGFINDANINIQYRRSTTGVDYSNATAKSILWPI
jgi:hypothetical protein